MPRAEPKLKDAEKSKKLEENDEERDQVYDTMALVKLINFIVLGGFALGAGITFCCGHCFEKLYAQPLKQKFK